MHVIAAKAVALGQAMTEDFKQYQQQIIKNAQRLCGALQKKVTGLFPVERITIFSWWT